MLLLNAEMAEPEVRPRDPSVRGTADGIPLRVYMTGGWGYGNRGDDAILVGMLAGLSGFDGEVEYGLTSFFPEETTRLHGLPSTPSVHRMMNRKRPLSLARLAAYHLWRRGLAPMPGFLRRHLAEMSESDVIVFGGGGYLNEAWKDAFPARLAELELARRSDTPYLIIGQTFGPFADQTVREKLSEVLANAERITYRDRSSARVLALAGVNPARSGYTADLAHLAPGEQEVGDEGTTVRVGMMFQTFRPYGTATGLQPFGRIGDQRQYERAIREVAEGLSEIPDVVFSMIPSTTRNEPFMRRLEKYFRELDVELEFRSLEECDTSGFISSCQNVDVMLSTNMHPIVLASMAAVPSVALSYNFKVDDYMRRLERQSSCFRIDDFEPSSVVASVKGSLREARPDPALEARVSDAVRQASESIDLIKDLLDERSASSRGSRPDLPTTQTIHESERGRA